MKRTLLISVLLLLVGATMQAQSVATEQMDERFNDGTTLPYGWFTEGWTVKDGVIQTKSSSGFSLDLESLFGNKEEPKTEDPEDTETEADGDGDGNGDGDGDGKGDGDGDGDGNKFDISSLLNSLMGGDNKENYLLTPPLVVNEGETLVFSAKKAKKDSGSGMSLSFGSSDSTFVVERTVYSRNQWVRVADFTAELDTVFKTFTIANTPAGEYRFRFKAGDSGVQIDSIAGLHIDNEAPDIHIIENDARAWHLDFSLCNADSTRTLKVINTATGTLNVNITPEDATLFSVSESSLAVNAADTMAVNITFNFAAGKAGKNETNIAFTPTDERVWGKTLRATAVVTQPNVWVEDFNTNVQPKGFFTEGWEFHDNVATTSSAGGMGAMFGGGSSTSFLMTPPLTVESADEVLLFSAKKGSSGGFDLGGMMGGSSSSVVIEKSVYGSNKWEKVKEFTEPLDSAYRTLWVGYIEPGEYRFRIVASDSIVVDSIAGFHIDNNAPDIYVLHNNTAATAINYGMPQANSTETFAVVNTGTGTLQVGVGLTNSKDFAISGKNLGIEANDTATVDVTYIFDEQQLGTHQGLLTFTPTTSVLVPLSYPLTAYSTYTDAWREDFEPEYIPEDETQPREVPAGWETTGWEVVLPSSGGGLMDMFSGMMGGSDEAPKTWAATTESEAYELVTPRLQAKKGDVLRFEAELGGGGLMDMLGMFMGGGGASGQLNVYYSLAGDDTWTYYNTFVQNGFVYFVAPYSGIYQLRFTSPKASLDNFFGFREPIDEAVLYDDRDDLNAEVLEAYNGQTVNVSYDRVLSARDNGDGTWTPKAYTICLPYDMAFNEYVERGNVKLYQLSFVDNYYKQFVFTNVADKAEAGKAYLAVVEKDDVSLNAVGVTLMSQPTASEAVVVNDYEDWFFNENLKKVGTWEGSFRSIAATEADTKSMFCLLDDGTWAMFTSEDDADAKLSPFRGFFLSDEPGSSPEAPAKAAPEAAKFYRTMFSNAGVTNVSGGSVPDAINMLFDADIPTPSSHPTGIEPTIQTIEADGTCRYFDLQGRMLSGKPLNGIYIYQGKKIITNKE